jgi:hypothetical protein
MSKALQIRNQIRIFFERVGWEASELNQLFDLGVEVDFSLEFVREYNNELIAVKYNIEDSSLIMSIDGLSSYVTLLFDLTQNCSQFLLICEEFINEISLNNFQSFLNKIIDNKIKVFQLKNDQFIQIVSNETKQNNLQMLQNFLAKHNWVIINNTIKTYITKDNLTSENWDIAACYYNSYFKLYFTISIDSLLIHHFLYTDEIKLFSNIYIYSSKLDKIAAKINQWKDQLNQENYQIFIQEIINISEKTLFYDHDNLYKITKYLY